MRMEPYRYIYRYGIHVMMLIVKVEVENETIIHLVHEVISEVQVVEL